MGFEPPMPSDFPAEPYESIQKRISVDLGESLPDSRREFAGGWNALRYRYLACSELTIREFTLSIERPQAHLERYHQERGLFGFFVTGQSAIESLCYGLYATASILNPTAFPLHTQQALKQIKWGKTVRLFSDWFAGEALTQALDELANSPESVAWREQRNILAHRATPGRIISCGGSQDGLVEWSGIELNQETTAARRRWLLRTLGEILLTADKFATDHLP